MLSVTLPQTCINKDPEAISEMLAYGADGKVWLEEDSLGDIQIKQEYIHITKSGRVKRKEGWAATWYAKYPTSAVGPEAPDRFEFFPESYVSGESHLFNTRLIWNTYDRLFGLMSDHHSFKGPKEGQKEFVREVNRLIPIVDKITSHKNLFQTDKNNWQLLVDQDGIRIAAYAHGGGYMYLTAFRYPEVAE